MLQQLYYNYCIVIESWTRVPVHQPGSVTEETECDGVEEDAELCDDNDDGVTPPPSPSQDDTTTLPVTGNDSDVSSISVL